MADKAPQLEDFAKTSNLTEFKALLEKTNDLVLLSQLEEWEKANDGRKGAIAAINERQGVLVDDIEVIDNETEKGIEVQKNEAGTIADDEQPEIGTASLEGSQTITQQHPPLGAHVESNGTTDTVTQDPNFKTDDTIEQEVSEEYQEQLKAETVKKIKEIRLEVDRIHQFANGHLRVGVSCETPLLRAKAWLGKLLGVIGTPNPYKVEGKIKDPKDIPATAEKNDGTDFVVRVRNFSLVNPIPAIQQLREDIEAVAELVDELDIINIDFGHDSRKAHICKIQAWVNLCESKFELGYNLAEIRG